MKHGFWKAVAGMVCAFALTGLLSGCGAKNQAPLTAAAQLNDSTYTIGVSQGASGQNVVAKEFPNAKVKYYTKDADAYLAVQQGKIDAFVYDRVTMEFAIAQGLTGVTLLPENVGDAIDIAVGISPESDIANLQTKLNEFIAALKADGTLDDMRRRWVNEAADTLPDIEEPENPALTIKVGTTGLLQPFSYYKGDQLCGYDIELIRRFALWMNAKVEISTFDYDGIVAAAESGSIDCIIANLNVTEERKQSILFSDNIYESYNAVMVRDDGSKDGKEAVAVSTGRVAPETARIGVMDGSTNEIYAEQHYPDANRQNFKNYVDSCAALSAGKLDYAMMDYTNALRFTRSYQDLEIASEFLTDEKLCIGVSQNNPELFETVNEVMNRFLADGTVDAAIDHWIKPDGSDYDVVETPKLPDAPKIKVAIVSSREPTTFMMNDAFVGLDIEIIDRILYELGYQAEYMDMEWGAVIVAIGSGKADMTLGMYNTPERAEKLFFTEPYFTNPQLLVARKTEGSQATPVQLATTSGSASYTDPAQLDGKQLAVITGSIIDQTVSAVLPNASFSYFNTATDCVSALQNGKVEGFPIDAPMAQLYAALNDDLTVLPGAIVESGTGMAFRKGSELTSAFNSEIARLRQSGLLDELAEKWMGADDSVKILPELEHTGENGTLRVACAPALEPMCYVGANGVITGYDIELLMHIAQGLGKKLELIQVDFGGLMPMIESGKADVTIGCLTISDERRKLVDMTDSYYDGGTVMLVRKGTDTVGGGAAASSVPFEQANFGVMTGSTAENYLAKTYPSAKISTFSAIADALTALSNGKVDYVMTAYTTSLNAVRLNPSLAIVQNDVIRESSAIAVSKEKPELLTQLNETLSALRSDGTLEKIVANWTTQDGEYTREARPVSDGKNGVLRVAVSADREPMCFVMDGKYEGIDCELIERIAYQMGMTVEYQNMQFSSLVAALVSNKADVIISNMTPTEERKQSVNFTDPYFDNPQVFVACKPEATPAAEPVVEADGEYTSLSQMSGKLLSCITGSIFDQLTLKAIPDAKFAYFNNGTDELTALKAGKVEGIPIDEPVAKLFVAQNPDLTTVPEIVMKDYYAMALAKDSPLTAEFNREIAKLRSEGAVEEMLEKWIGTDESVKKLPSLSYPAPNGTIRVACSVALPPMCYAGSDGVPLGVEVELVTRVAEALGKKVELISVDFSGLIPMLQSGKADVAIGCMSVSEERKKVVDMTDPHYDGGIVMVVRKAAGQTVEATGFFEDLKQSFIRTFVTENRWKLVLDGLFVTVTLSICSGVLGSVFGFGICMLRRSKRRLASVPAAMLIRIIQGTPIVVLLMILYYIIFGKLDISAILVAILGFAVNFGVYVSEMIRTGIDAVDKGQIEAAHALGFTKMRTFWKITFPQAARHFLPVFKGEFISMVKMTSVVGYIAIQDLTKVSDIIRSRTLEAFFPLIATAVLYFIVANLLTILLTRLEISLDPKRRKRAVKGVVTQ